MAEEKLCIKCHGRPVHIKKRGLCSVCYQAFLRKSGSVSTQKNLGDYCPKTQKEKIHKREIEFIKNFFAHNRWIYHPAVFYFNGLRYSPDFYDMERNAFIEVSGSRQAYHKNKDKYVMFRENYPEIKFEIRQPDGSLLNENDRNKKWQQNTH